MHVFQLCPLCLPPRLLAFFDFSGYVDEKVVSFLSHLKEVKQVRKLEITLCENLSPSLIATICGGHCCSNFMEEVVVTSFSSVGLFHNTIQATSSHSGKPP